MQGKRRSDVLGRLGEEFDALFVSGQDAWKEEFAGAAVAVVDGTLLSVDVSAAPGEDPHPQARGGPVDAGQVRAIGVGVEPAGEVIAVGQDCGEQQEAGGRGGAADTGEQHLQAQSALGAVDGVALVSQDQREARGQFGHVAQQQVEFLAGDDEDVGEIQELHLVADVLGSAEKRGDPQAEQFEALGQVPLHLGSEGAGGDDVDGEPGDEPPVVLVAGPGCKRVEDGPLGYVGLACRGWHGHRHVPRCGIDQAGVQGCALGRPNLDNGSLGDDQGFEIALPQTAPGGRAAQQ
ncbi:hypothetical protein EDD95_5662 [Streptomyces sp. CEV 2-1]|nr:hypothetical protein EDD95_5662 [Streptomyces sp. CEV 2-1]